MATEPSEAVQDIRFARSADGVGIAYAVHGSGPPLLVDACWLSHLQFDWQSPVWRHYLVELGRIATVIRYDERGHGLSDRGVTDHSLRGPGRRPRGRRRRRRPRAVRAAGDGPGRTGGHRVRGPASGATDPAGLLRQLRRRASRRRRPRSWSCTRAFEALIRVGWARPTSEFRRVFSSLMIPGGTEEQMRWLDDLQRMAVDAETAMLARSQRQVTDSSARLAELDLPMPGAAQSRRPDERVRPQPRTLAAGIRGRAVGGAGEQQPHRARRRTGVAGRSCDEITDVPRSGPAAVSAAAATTDVDRLGAVAARARHPRASPPGSATTTPSPPSWCCRSAPSSGTCRTRTRSSACRAAPPAPPPSPAAGRAPDTDYAPAATIAASAAR